MKHLKIYEEKENISEVLANKLTKKFFADLDEFDGIVIQKPKPEKFVFCICFSEIHKETIEALEKFWEFTNNNKNLWSLEAGNFTYSTEPKIFEIFHLNERIMLELLEKLQLEEDAKKYNM